MRQQSLDDDDNIGMIIEKISGFIEAQQFACTLKNIENENEMNGRTFQVICKKHNTTTSMLI